MKTEKENDTWQIVSEENLPTENGMYWFYAADGVVPMIQAYYHVKSKRCRENALRAYTHFQKVNVPNVPTNLLHRKKDKQ